MGTCYYDTKGTGDCGNVNCPQCRPVRMLASLPNIRYPESGRMPATATTPDESVADLQRRIRGMLVGDEYEFAEDTLRGILKTVTDSNRVTLGQINAVDNIAANPHRVNTRRFR